MAAEKLTLQPITPSGAFDFINWIWYIVQYLFWALMYPFNYFL